MKKVLSKNTLLIVALGLSLGMGSVASAALVDVAQAPNPAGEFFVPTDAQKYDSPYYRYASSDWGWQHSALSYTIIGSTTRELSVSAFDVDANQGEDDRIYAYDDGVADWVLIGSLAGGNDIWSYTTFNLAAQFNEEILTGLKVKMDIDSGFDGWAVTLAKSVLSLDGGTKPPPTPGAVPEPATMLLFGTGLAGLAAFGRRKVKK